MTTWFASERPTAKILAQLVSHVATRAILLASTVVVARTVGVAGYGLFALGLVLYQAGLLLRDAGLGQALIILGGGDTGMTWRTFLTASLIGISLAILIGALSDAFTTLLGLPDAAPFVRVLALAFGIGSLGIASNAALERDLRFTARASVEISSYVALGVVTIGGLYLGWGALALAWGYVAQGAVQAALAIVLEPPWRDRTHGTVRFRSLAGYGGLLWGSAVLTYLATNIDNIAVAALGGAAAIGVYALSYTVGTMIAISLAQVLNRVALPYYARAVDDAARLVTFSSVVPLSTALAILAAAPVIALAPEIRDVLLGPTAPDAPLAILAAYGVIRAVGVAIGTALNGSGAARPVTWTAAVNVGLIAILVVPAFSIAGPSGVAVVDLVSLAVSVALLRGATHRHGASLAFLGTPAVGVTGLVLLVLGPLGPVPLILRVAAGAGIMVLAAAWAWRIMRSGRQGVQAVASAS
jgi:O-antigen/teichoic acid export membrane protein